ncbi:hypothetical protein [Nocardia donostiensis]|uniref:hypothetical protein n=1 Tax=Nocardia donostiensis TaxID=1538463 RepID=UPI0020CA7482|nr:hypothetical protein [Nocardia donostiensis]
MREHTAELRGSTPGDAARAAHLVVDDQPHLFHDTVAVSLLGTQAEELIGYHRQFGEHPILSGTRTQVV